MKINHKISLMKSMRMKKILMAALFLSAGILGATAGEVVGEPQSGFSLSPSGAATYTIAVECPPGVNGMEPSVSLSYNSQSGQGIAGWGWNVSGSSVITKTCPNIYYDKISKPLNSDLSGDHLTLDGQRLVKVKEIDDRHVEFRTENDGLNRIIREGTDGNFCFTVYDTNGRKMLYSQLKTGATYYKGNLGWYLTEVSDRYGNYMTYTYETTVSGKNIQEVLLKKIAYGGNRTMGTAHSCIISFSYKKNLVTNYYVGGFAKQFSNLLDFITITSKTTSYRKYQLLYYPNYTRRDLLEAVRIYGNNGDFYQDIKVNWATIEKKLNERNIWSPQLSLENSYSRDKIWMPVDYDNDGYTDLVCYYKYNGNEWNRISRYHNDKGTLKYVEGSSIAYGLGDIVYPAFSCRFSQKKECQFFSILQKNHVDVPYLHLYDMNKTKDFELMSLPASHKGERPLCSIGDFNRDGYDDIVILEVVKDRDGKYPLTVFLGEERSDLFSGSPVTLKKTVYKVPLSGKPKKLFASDLNVDGNLDIMILTANGYWVYKNTTAGEKSVTFKNAFPNNTSEVESEVKACYGKHVGINPGDFNGDGKLDFYMCHVDGDFIMEGSGDFSFVRRTSPISCGKSTGDFEVVLDYDKDGRSDIVSYKNNGLQVAWNDHGYYQTFVSKKSSLEENMIFQGQVMVGDFDGDGRADLLSAEAPSLNNGGPSRFFIVSTTSPVTNEVVSSVQTPTKLTKITYSTLMSPTVYKRTGMATCANVESFLAPMQVVSSVDIGGKTTTYTYEDALYETTGKGFLGFAATTATSLGLTTRTESRLNESPTFLNLYRTVLLKGTEVVKSTTFTNKVVASGRKFQLRTTKIEERDNLRGTLKTSTFANYNSYNVPATTTVDYGANVKEITTLSDFQSDDTYNTCLPKKKVVKKSNSGGNYTRTTTYEYDDNFAIAKSVENSGTALAVTETHTYDSFGNLTSLKTEANDCEPQTTTFTYTTSGRFLASLVEQDGTKTTITNDEKYCRPSKKVVTAGAISQTTNFIAYDGFNHCLSRKHPDGREETITIVYGAGRSRNQCQYYIERRCPGEPTVQECYKNGKKQFVSTLAMDGVWRDQQIDYDFHGRPYRRSIVDISSPVATSQGTFFPEAVLDYYRYDTYGRITEADEAGGKTTYAYNGLKTTITSPTGIKVLEYNAAGQLIKSTENGRSVSFEYYPSGLLKKSTPQDGKAVTMTYDVAGNRTKLVDPDAGETVWEYDSYGREISIWQKKVSPKERTYTRYDEEGRMVSIEGPEWQVHYTYDTSNRLVEEVNHITECKKTYTYDKFGRITKCVESLPDKSFTTKYAYAKNYGGATKVTYPSGYAVTNVYDDYGNLTAVKNGETTLWQWTELDKMGRLTKDAVCGSVVRTREYDDAGKVWNETAYKGNVALMNLVYDYENGDESSNGGALAPVRRQDLISRCSERIGYSDNRIASLSVSNPRSGMQGDYSYDTQGNLIGTYDHRWYRIAYGMEGATPHQLSMVSYEGRFAPHGERKISFNSTLWKAKKVTEAGLTYEYEYGTDKQRFKTTLKRGSKVLRTRYYAGDYELTLDSLGKKREVHYIYGGNGLAAIYVKNAGKDSLFAAATDRQGSLMATMHTASGKVERYSYDPFGRRRNADNWLQSVSAEPRFSRGYCMHEHVPEMDMIDMNGRLYDPTLCQFLSPDPYIQDPTNWQNYNRYGYCMQNPMLYTDPSGEFVWAAVIIGAVVGAYMGGTLANDGQMNPTKWNYSAGQTWGYMAGGAVVGAISGAVGGCVAASGMPFANTVGIAVGSFVNSVGTTLYTEGKYANVSISFGACSYNFLNNEFGYIGKSGNSTMENIGYGFGAMANLSDVVAAIKGGGQDIVVNSKSTHNDEWWSHSSITDEKGESIVSVGPEGKVEKIINSSKTLRGFIKSLIKTWKNSIKPADTDWSSYFWKKGTWKVRLHNVSTEALLNYSSNIKRWDLMLNSCVGHTTRALWSAGVPTMYAFHPYLLSTQLQIRQIGIYASPYFCQMHNN